MIHWPQSIVSHRLLQQYNFAIYITSKVTLTWLLHSNPFEIWILIRVQTYRYAALLRLLWYAATLGSHSIALEYALCAFRNSPFWKSVLPFSFQSSAGYSAIPNYSSAKNACPSFRKKIDITKYCSHYWHFEKAEDYRRHSFGRTKKKVAHTNYLQ